MSKFTLVDKAKLEYGSQVQGYFNDWNTPKNGTIKAYNLGVWIYKFTYVDFDGPKSRQIYPGHITIKNNIYYFEN